LVIILANARNVLVDDEGQVPLVEDREPLVPLHQLDAAGILRALGAVLVLIGCLVEDQPQHRLRPSRRRYVDDRGRSEASGSPLADRLMIGKRYGRHDASPSGLIGSSANRIAFSALPSP